MGKVVRHCRTYCVRRLEYRGREREGGGCDVRDGKEENFALSRHCRIVLVPAGILTLLDWPVSSGGLLDWKVSSSVPVSLADGFNGEIRQSQSRERRNSQCRRDLGVVEIAIIKKLCSTGVHRSIAVN
jgi:hypothetical protein